MDGRKLGKSLNVVHNDEIWYVQFCLQYAALISLLVILLVEKVEINLKFVICCLFHDENT